MNGKKYSHVGINTILSNGHTITVRSFTNTPSNFSKSVPTKTDANSVHCVKVGRG